MQIIKPCVGYNFYNIGLWNNIYNENIYLFLKNEY